MSAPSSPSCSKPPIMFTRSQSFPSPVSSQSQPSLVLDMTSHNSNTETVKTNNFTTREDKVPVPKVNIYNFGDSLIRAQSYDKLDSRADKCDKYDRRCMMPPYSDMRSVSADHQTHDVTSYTDHREHREHRQSNLYRTVSRATLLDQDTGNIYEVKY